ncbi:MAG: glyoxalase [Chloroflexota bacterium]|nr:MAG: glyoxalase [Chloroflexota bacterium]
MDTTYRAPADIRIGHVHLKVADIDRAVAFYRDILGFDLLVNMGSAAFLSAGGYHHHVGLNTWESRGGQPPAPGTTGLYHFALNYPTRRDLAIALKHLIDAGWPIDGASDHTTHEAIYLRDPDGNGIELACDRAAAVWRPLYEAAARDPSHFRALNKPLDFDGLMREAGGSVA